MTYRQPFQGDWPITQRYGEIILGVTYKGRPHTGLDYGCPSGTPILASADGVVQHSNFDAAGYGKFITIQHPDGNATLYAHLNDRTVTVGQKVRQGDIIGHCGSTGNSTGPHLHFETRKKWNDPASHFDPMTLPLMSMVDPAPGTAPLWDCPHSHDCRDSEEITHEGVQSPFGNSPRELKNADDFHEGDILKVSAPLGAKAFFNDAFDYFEPAPCGTAFYYTGKTMEHNGYTYMQVMPIRRPVWVAVNDGETQILDT